MKIAVLVLLCAACVAFAEDSNQYYNERYPGDGMKQNPKKGKDMKVGKILGTTPAESNDGPAVTTTNDKPSRAARYITPSVSSKSWLPPRKPQPKTRTVVFPERDGKYPPNPSVSDKVGLADRTLGTPAKDSSAATNAPDKNASAEVK